MAAARHWARAGQGRAETPPENAVAALVAVGVPAEQARERVAAQYDPAERREAAGAAFAVLPENWRTVTLWCAVERQWIFTPGGRLFGLDHARVEATMRMLGIRRKRQARLLEGLRVMEGAALAAM